MRVRITRVFEADVDARRLFLTGKPVWRWADNVRRSMERNTKAAAPVNKRANKSRQYRHLPPGSLRESIYAEQKTSAATMMCDITVTTYSPYAVYVIKGTDTIVSSRKMWLPANPPYRATGHYRVRGQRANNFLAEGIRRTSRRHPSIPKV